MRVCVVGAGAIGGLLAVRLALSGQTTSVIARGPHLAAIRERGLTLVQGGETMVARDLAASDRFDQFGPQDLVILALKAHQIEPVVGDLESLLGPDTALLTLQNGIPWWYFQKIGNQYEGRTVPAVDPAGILAQNIDPDRIIGCIAYPAAEISKPGVIKHVEGMRFPVGELDGSESDRVAAVSQVLVDAGFKSPVLTDIRSEIWLKLWGNLTFNPISALTHSTLVDICQFPLSRQLATAMMSEAQTIGERLGSSFRVTLEKRIDGAEKVGKHKTSMLQDLEVGKALEIDGMLGAVVELGELTETPTPTLRAVHACVSLLDKTVQEEGLRVRAEKK